MNMTRTAIAAAQLSARDGDIAFNLREHERLIRLAAAYDVRLLVFPEMSVTGYVREAADQLAFEPGDSRLDVLRRLSALYRMIFVAGAPVRLGGEKHIGSFIIFPSGTEALYTKHYLYEGEADFYSPNQDYTPMILLDGDKYAPAICFDIENPPHIAQATGAGATVYIPSIFYSEKWTDHCHRLLSSYAATYSLPVLMSNYCGYHYHTSSGGQSAFWDGGGDRLASLDKDISGLVVAVRENGVWSAHTAVDNGDVYTVCPVYQSRSLTLSRTVPGDAEELLQCYSDERAVPLFNSDNCNGDTFHYTTPEQLMQTIELWEFSYKARSFVRWTVSLSGTGEKIGTVEMFGRTSDPELGNFGILRVDLRSDHETQPVIIELLEIAKKYFFDAFTVDTILTKAIPAAETRVKALLQQGYEPFKGDPTRFVDYYVKSRL
jgi:predicted amidohydrolase/RimJ/RimL family protein N-acetyltransferase